MGRLTELFDFLNSDKMPTPLQILHRYSYISVDDELKALRREWRKGLKKDKQGELDLD